MAEMEGVLHLTIEEEEFMETDITLMFPIEGTIEEDMKEATVAILSATAAQEIWEMIFQEEVVMKT